jgi:hypothetical protein
MTILTPNYQQAQQANGFAGAHVIAAHEPTREGEQPPATGSSPAQGPVPAAAAGPLKVALIGTAPSSRMLAPYGDPSWKIWACSPGNQNTLPRVDLWFELHSNLLWPEHENYGKPYIEWLKQQKFPIYMQDQSLVPNAMPFPKDDLVAQFGDEFFTSSFAWMMALAIKMGAAEIALYGIDMASRDEYIRQRPGFYYFKREAMKLGIKVSAPNESDIMQSPPLYAYVDSTPFGRKILARRQEVSGRINGFAQQIEQATRSKTYLEGALEDLDYFESIWSGVSNDLGRLTYENAQLKAQIARMQQPMVMVAPNAQAAGMTQVWSNWPLPQNQPQPVARRRKRKLIHPEPVVEQPDG